jgi:hypothetical protein
MEPLKITVWAGIVMHHKHNGPCLDAAVSRTAILTVHTALCLAAYLGLGGSHSA